MVENLIVTRHHGLVQWLSKRGIRGTVVSHVTDPTILDGKIVYGVLPLSLASRALAVVTIDMPILPAEMRGKDLSPEDMDRWGASLEVYVVHKAQGNELKDKIAHAIGLVRRW